MKKKGLIILISSIMTISLFAGCSSNNGQQPAQQTQSTQTTTKKAGTAVDGNEINIEKAAMRLVKTSEEGKYQIVGSEELKSWIDSKKDMVIVDTMPASNFKDGHIPGAVNAELPKTGIKDVKPEQKEAFVKLLPADKNKPVVIYCGFVACERSDVGAKIAKELGYKNVYRYPGGIVAWRDAKYAEEK